MKGMFFLAVLVVIPVVVLGGGFVYLVWRSIATLYDDWQLNRELEAIRTASHARRERGRESRVEGRESRVEGRESRVESPESRVESPESRVESQTMASGGRKPPDRFELESVEGAESSVEGAESSVEGAESGVEGSAPGIPSPEAEDPSSSGDPNRLG